MLTEAQTLALLRDIFLASGPYPAWRESASTEQLPRPALITAPFQWGQWDVAGIARIVPHGHIGLDELREIFAAYADGHLAHQDDPLHPFRAVAQMLDLGQQEGTYLFPDHRIVYPQDRYVGAASLLWCIANALPDAELVYSAEDCFVRCRGFEFGIKNDRVATHYEALCVPLEPFPWEDALTHERESGGSFPVPLVYLWRHSQALRWEGETESVLAQKAVLHQVTLIALWAGLRWKRQAAAYYLAGCPDPAVSRKLRRALRIVMEDAAQEPRRFAASLRDVVVPQYMSEPMYYKLVRPRNAKSFLWEPDEQWEILRKVLHAANLDYLITNNNNKRITHEIDSFYREGR